MIPSSFSHTEFSLTIRWHPRGSHDKLAPGFYLTLGYGNEGEVDYPVDNYRLSPEDVRTMLTGADLVTHAGGSIEKIAGDLNAAAKAQVDRRRKALEDEIERARAELKAMGTDR